jgi:hypothetical protein
MRALTDGRRGANVVERARLEQLDVGLNAANEDLRILSRHARVRVPDGRIGEVIGFYREEDEPVLVLFVSGDSQRYGRADLRLIS